MKWPQFTLWRKKPVVVTAPSVAAPAVYAGPEAYDPAVLDMLDNYISRCKEAMLEAAKQSATARRSRLIEDLDIEDAHINRVIATVELHPSWYYRRD